MEYDDLGWQLFLDLCLKAKDKSQLEKVWDLLLTLEEKKNLASRVRIIQALLEKKLTQREIADKYNVSISQITRGSNALKILEKEFRQFIESSLLS